MQSTRIFVRESMVLEEGIITLGGITSYICMYIYIIYNLRQIQCKSDWLPMSFSFIFSCYWSLLPHSLLCQYSSFPQVKPHSILTLYSKLFSLLPPQLKPRTTTIPWYMPEGLDILFHGYLLSMLIAALVTTARKWKQLTCPSIREWKIKM